jgi:hypothetical protein
MNCFQVCDENVDGVGCAAGFLDYAEANGGLNSVVGQSVSLSPTFMALLIVAMAALAMGIGFASKVREPLVE